MSSSTTTATGIGKGALENFDFTAQGDRVQGWQNIWKFKRKILPAKAAKKWDPKFKYKFCPYPYLTAKLLTVGKELTKQSEKLGKTKEESTIERELQEKVVSLVLQ